MSLINPDMDSPSDSDSSIPTECSQEENVPLHVPPHTQLPVAIPPRFLLDAPPDAQPLSSRRIIWSETPLHDRTGFAMVVDNVLSPSECSTLLSLAEASAGRKWGSATVSVGPGVEVLRRGYRDSGRILFESAEVAGRIWDRCMAAEGLLEGLPRQWELGGEWEVAGLSEKMRFLRYEGGQFFRPHCDASYTEPRNGAPHMALYTLHLYLNGSAAEAGRENADMVGGATRFHSFDHGRWFDVHPRAGRVLVFVHKGMYHSGEEVVEGIKVSVRADVMFRRVGDVGGSDGV